MQCIFGAMVGILFLAANSYAMAQEGFSGTIFFRSGDRDSFYYLGQINKLSTRNVIYGRLGSQAITIELSEISEMIFSNPESSYRNKDSTIIIFNKERERFTIEHATTILSGRSGDICYVYGDPITKKQKNSCADIKNNISRIVLGETSGDLKINPSTGDFFPPYYNYDPFTGEKLEWGKRESRLRPRNKTAMPASKAGIAGASGSIVPATAPPPSQQTTSKGPVDKVLNAALARSGVNPESPEAKAAKELGKTWLNPGASQEEIDRAMRNVTAPFTQ